MSERGQASVELVGAVPALLLLALILFQLLAVGYSAVLAGSAAEAGALALAGGGDARAGARDAVPGWSRAGMTVSVSGGEVQRAHAAAVAARGDRQPAGGARLGGRGGAHERALRAGPCRGLAARAAPGCRACVAAACHGRSAPRGAAPGGGRGRGEAGLWRQHRRACAGRAPGACRSGGRGGGARRRGGAAWPRRREQSGRAVARAPSAARRCHGGAVVRGAVRRAVAGWRSRYGRWRPWCSTRPPRSESADLIVVVTPGDAEPALAQLVAASAGGGAALIVSNRPREPERWAAGRPCCCRSRRLGARMAAAGWPAGGPFGRAIAELACACGAVACA